LQARLLSENPSGEKTYAVIFAKGDEIMSGLTEFADREKIAGGHFTAIGALASARFGWFDVSVNNGAVETEPRLTPLQRHGCAYAGLAGLGFQRLGSTSLTS
jgi:hypothetical protein